MVRDQSDDEAGKYFHIFPRNNLQVLSKILKFLKILEIFSQLLKIFLQRYRNILKIKFIRLNEDNDLVGFIYPLLPH